MPKARYVELKTVELENIRTYSRDGRGGFRSFTLPLSEAKSLYYTLRDVLREAGEDA